MRQNFNFTAHEKNFTEDTILELENLFIRKYETSDLYSMDQEGSNKEIDADCEYYAELISNIMDFLGYPEFVEISEKEEKLVPNVSMSEVDVENSNLLAEFDKRVKDISHRVLSDQLKPYTAYKFDNKNICATWVWSYGVELGLYINIKDITVPNIAVYDITFRKRGCKESGYKICSMSDLDAVMPLIEQIIKRLLEGEKVNVKGLKLNIDLINHLIPKVDSISIYKGIEAFNNFVWSGFDQREFFNLIKAFSYLKERHTFDYMSDNNMLVFNYSTDVTEMDIVSVSNDNEEPIFIDIEVKNGEKSVVEKTLATQIKKRIQEHLPQLVKKGRYLVIGIVNNTFIEAYYFDGKQKRMLSTINELNSITCTFKEFDNVEEYLLQSSDIASISKVCSDIRKGDYPYYEETNKIYSSIKSKAESNKVIIVYGNAGTGKSVLALRLFFNLENTKILMLNSKLYNALNLGGYLYLNDRSTFNSEHFLNIVDENTIAIIDECQRLSIEELKRIANKCKTLYLFGDNKQAFYESNTLLTEKELEKNFKADGIAAYSRLLKKSRRYPDEVNASLSYLTSKSMKAPSTKLSNDYKINIWYDEKKFIDDYMRSAGIKKIYAPVYDVMSNKLTIGNQEFIRASRIDDNFSLTSFYDGYYGTTYHALSFDIDNSYIYLPKTIITTYKGKAFLFSSVKNKTTENIDLYLNELNILFTRGRKSLNICIPDIEAYLYLNEKILKIKKS